MSAHSALERVEAVARHNLFSAQDIVLLSSLALEPRMFESLKQVSYQAATSLVQLSQRRLNFFWYAPGVDQQDMVRKV